MTELNDSVYVIKDVKAHCSSSQTRQLLVRRLRRRGHRHAGQETKRLKFKTPADADAALGEFLLNTAVDYVLLHLGLRRSRLRAPGTSVASARRRGDAGRSRARARDQRRRARWPRSPGRRSGRLGLRHAKPVAGTVAERDVRRVIGQGQGTGKFHLLHQAVYFDSVSPCST